MVLLASEKAYAVRELVTIAPVRTRVRGIAAEVPLGPDDGLPRPCVVNLYSLATVPKQLLAERLAVLSPARVRAIHPPSVFALRLDDRRLLFWTTWIEDSLSDLRQQP